MLKVFSLRKFTHKQQNLVFVRQQVRMMGISLYQLVNTLKSFAPLTLAENWDNVGLLVDPMTTKPINTILLTNDLTEDIVEEAVQVKAGLIVTYHPNIFKGLKTISTSTWKERIVVQCIRNEIAVFSPHTSWDSKDGGVNDWLASAFEFHCIKPIIPKTENPNQGPGRFLELKDQITMENAIAKVKKHIGINSLRVGLGRQKGIDSLISTIALCAGSGTSVLYGVKADLYLTGEMSHHDILDCTQNGIHVILCEHSNSERGFLNTFQQYLIKVFPDGLNVVLSVNDKDPLVCM